ncbi:MAG: CBASS oligonucleotide cyclase, partial [Elusimicrobiota bacterium]
MGKEHVNHSDIVRFADERVNLPKDKADQYRKQAASVRERIENYLKEHDDFSLKKILLSGSLAKGTALRTLNDIDMACYISGASAPHEVKALLQYLTERLRKAFPNFSPDQVTANNYSVTVSFRGSGLDVDVVPILYDGDPDWYGNLVSQEDGTFLATCIPRHLEFIRERKARSPVHFAQVVRLIKFWSARMKLERDGFRFKSFMVELVLAHLSDKDFDFSNYPEAMQHFFTYIVRGGLRELIVFDDYYYPAAVEKFNDPVRII